MAESEAKKIPSGNGIRVEHVLWRGASNAADFPDFFSSYFWRHTRENTNKNVCIYEILVYNEKVFRIVRVFFLEKALVYFYNAAV